MNCNRCGKPVDTPGFCEPCEVALRESIAKMLADEEQAEEILETMDPRKPEDRVEPGELLKLPAVTRQEHATILAALRHWQQGLPATFWCQAIATDGNSFPALPDDRINALCMRLSEGAKP